MNVAQLGGPIVGGLLLEAGSSLALGASSNRFAFPPGGFMCPFVIFGALQMLLAVCAYWLMTSPEQVRCGNVRWI